MQLRKLTEENDFSKLVLENGYGDLNIPDIQHPTWVIHLVLIYFKRFYCNKGNPEKCPLYQKKWQKGYANNKE